MRIIMLGPPGAGKGTQAMVIARNFDIPHISTGEMFRSAIKEQTPLGKSAQEYMSRGDLVPDEMVIGMVKEKIGKEECRLGFLLDGFPRTLEQGIRLDEILKEMNLPLDKVIELTLGDEEILRRLVHRRSCPQCKKIYHLLNNPPHEIGLCNECHIPLIHRDDDREDVILNRLREYYAKTLPLSEYYENQGVLNKVNGELSSEAVLKEIMAVMGN